MDETTKAKEAWRKYYEDYFGGEDNEPDEFGRDIAALQGISDFQSSVIEELNRKKSGMIDLKKIALIDEFIEIIKTTLPKEK